MRKAKIELIPAVDCQFPSDDLSGRQFDRYTAVNFAGRNLHKEAFWLCRCVCGNENFVSATALKRGTSKSCGCKRDEMHRARLKTHGMTNTKIFEVWSSMKKRCLNPKHRAYKNYGGRGITVCDRWLESFEAFLEDMGFPSEGMTLDRIDNNRGYSKENCRWATMTEQSNNRRNSLRLQVKGESLTPMEVSKKFGIPHTTLHRRLQRGWTHEEAALLPHDTTLPKKIKIDTL